MELDEIITLLKMTYWADKRSHEQVKASVENSRCYGVRLKDNNKLVGFARVITDYSTTYYLCDVVIHKEYRGKGLGTALISYIDILSMYDSLRGILITKNAHGLDSKFGFDTLNDRAMVKNLNC